MSAGDVSFDGRAGRFVERIYGSSKGALRLTAVWQQLCAAVPGLESGLPLRCWDAGGGAGQMTLLLAQQGHRVLLNDLSAEMLALADAALGEAGLQAQVEVRHAPIQAIDTGAFDLIVCHAVLEWVVDQAALIAALAARLAPGGTLSLMFYNRNALILTHAIKGNVDRLLRGDLVGHPGGLTPPNAAAPEQVAAALAASGLAVVRRHGIRSLSDFLPKSLRASLAPEVLRDLDARYGEQPPFSELARYQHWLCRAPSR